MFNKTTKSLYLIFVKAKGLSSDPTEKSLVLSDEEENGEQETEEENVDVTPPDSGGGELPDGRDGVSSVYLPITLLLEDLIVENLKLNKLKLYKLRAKPTAKLLGSL